MLKEEKTDVVIVGAGPVGLATAIGLAQRGMSFVIVDALAEQQNTSRAAVIHARTIETLQEIGVAERLIEQGLKVPEFRIRDRDQVLIQADFRRLPSPTPFALMIPQDESEAILIERLAELGHRVRRPVVATGIEFSPEGALVFLEAPEGKIAIASRFVVAADGEHSKVRQWAGIEFPGATYGSFLLADVRMRWPISKEEVTLFFSREGTLVVAPMSKDRYRVVAQLKDAPSLPTIADVQKVIDQRGPRNGAEVTELLWGSRFQVHHKLGDVFRKGPVLLAGDAAHVHSPAGGQGMNLGLRDATALAQALADAMAGDETALDRYAETQRAAAQKVLAMTDRLTAVATMPGHWRTGLRNMALNVAGRLPFVTRKLANTLAGYDA